MPGQALVVRRIAESEMFYKNNIEYFIFPIFSEINLLIMMTRV